MKTFDFVLVRNFDEPWYPEFFFQHNKKAKFPFVCAYGAYKQALLYEENKKLFSSNTKEFSPFQPVLVRDDPSEPYTGDFFAKFDKANNVYDCIFSNWKECIPYQGNEHILQDEDSSFSPFEKVLIRYEDNPDFKWNIDFFIRINRSNPNNHKYRVISGYYASCLNYIGNEHLLGV